MAHGTYQFDIWVLEPQVISIRTQQIRGIKKRNYLLIIVPFQKTVQGIDNISNFVKSVKTFPICLQ